jgi:hypothetical protein
MDSEREAEFLDSLFVGMRRLVAEWRQDLSQLNARIAEAMKAQNSLYDWA